MSIKRWFVKCTVNMCADHEELVIVKANTERSARSLAINTLHKKGFFNINIISCEVDSNE